MSGEELRHAAITGNEAAVQRMIFAGGNVVSADQYGINSIHYAAWNGKKACLKLLLCVPYGITKDRKKLSSRNVVTVFLLVVYALGRRLFAS